jgi:hypothetical protein
VHVPIEGEVHSPPLWAAPFIFIAGVLVLTLLMHLARAIGMMHGHLAKALLVRPAGRVQAD